MHEISGFSKNGYACPQTNLGCSGLIRTWFQKCHNPESAPGIGCQNVSVTYTEINKLLC